MYDAEKPGQPARLVFILATAAIWLLFLFGRLVQVQIFEHDKYLKLARLQQEVIRPILPPRGTIYDSHMDELASSVVVRSVIAEPEKIQDMATIARELAPLLQINPKELFDRMTDADPDRSLILKRRIDPKSESEIEALGIDGVYLIDEHMRAYPNRTLACHVLGFVNLEDKAVAGLEMKYDKVLSGTQGRIQFEVDARRRSFRGKVIAPPIQGQSLVLSIDRSIQYVAERELASGVRTHRAAAGVAIVMESETGRILALASHPDYNSNTFNLYGGNEWRNRAVQDLFEPGSTLKVVVTSATKEAGMILPGELIDCQMGSMIIGGHVFHDHKHHGLLTFRQILEHSSNIGAAKLGLRLGREALHTALLKFGFGARTGIDLPAERIGDIGDCRNWSAHRVASISIGQGIAVTSMQILVAINAIANGGYRVRPSVVDRIADIDGDTVTVRSTERARILRPEVVAEMMQAFEGVVLQGTGRLAALEGYRAAGKTGTAQKAEDGHFSKTKYLSSFAGFAPLPQPKITVLVQIDEPKGTIYGGDVSAPVFQRIAQETLLRLGIPPDRSLPLGSVAQGRITGTKEP
jgi:cell division protein FtsI (penicillin-binding protein 3)